MHDAYLITNIAPHRHSHEHDLRIQSRPEHAAELSGLGGQGCGHGGEVDHFVCGRSGWHFGVFGKGVGGLAEGAVGYGGRSGLGECTESGASKWEFAEAEGEGAHFLCGRF